MQGVIGDVISGCSQHGGQMDFNWCVVSEVWSVGAITGYSQQVWSLVWSVQVVSVGMVSWCG